MCLYPFLCSPYKKHSNSSLKSCDISSLHTKKLYVGYIRTVSFSPTSCCHTTNNFNCKLLCPPDNFKLFASLWSYISGLGRKKDFLRKKAFKLFFDSAFLIKIHRKSAAEFGAADFHLSYKGCVCRLRCFSHVQLFVTLWTIGCQAPLSMGFSSELPCPPPGDLPDPGIEAVSLSLIGRWALYH